MSLCINFGNIVFIILCFSSCQKLKDVESIIKITELNGEDLVKDFSNEIERMLGSKMKSVKVRTGTRIISANLFLNPSGDHMPEAAFQSPGLKVLH